MNTALVALIAVLVGVGALLLVRGFASRKPVDAQAVRSAREHGAALIDVRSPQEYASGHVAGAINVPVDGLVADPSAAGPADKAVIVYCRSGARSARAAGALEKAGYDVTDLGGISAARTVLEG